MGYNQDAEKHRQIPIRRFDVEQLSARNNLSCINAEYAMTTDVEQPLVIVCLCAGKDKLIDGSHRLYKAKKLKIKTVLCYYVPAHEQKKYIVDFNENLYDKIVSEF